MINAPTDYMLTGQKPSDELQTILKQCDGTFLPHHSRISGAAFSSFAVLRVEVKIQRLRQQKLVFPASAIS